MKDKIVPIDFEFNSNSEERLNLVCCSFEVKGTTHNYWLYDESYDALKVHLLKLRDDGHIFLAFNVVAEAQSFISANIHPAKCQWIDLQNEWKMLINHWHKYAYGKQLIGGREVTTTPPTYGSDKTVNNSKAKTNLAAFLYKLLGVKVDTEHKTKMRDIIISNDRELIEANRGAIQKYCESDIKYLRPALSEVLKAYKEFFKFKDDQVTVEHILLRGDVSARCALMQSRGYPIDRVQVNNFIKNIPGLLKELCEDINSQFETPFFKWNNREQRYSMVLKPIKEWIKNSEYAKTWDKTEPSKTKPRGDYSLKLESWEKFFSFRHTYPRENLPAQVLRFLKTRQSLNGFLPKSIHAQNKETFIDSVGKDSRVRPYLNPYGAQSSRFQPKATSFIPLKASWMRSLIVPRTGRAIVAIDYGSQEFLLAALESQDEKMIDAYRSGDVYLYFSKLAGAVPWDGTKKEYAEQRNVFKSTTLGISYSMGPGALARKLTLDTGKPHTMDDAKRLIRLFNEAYPKYAKWVEDCRYTYRTIGYWMLKDGFVMFDGNDNDRSVSNMPIQGMGACILRLAIKLAQDRGLHVLYPLHDALYVEYDSGNYGAIDLLAQCMREAFTHYYTDKDSANLIRLDANTWSPDYADEHITTPNGMSVKQQSVYIDERSVDEYAKFKKYLR